MAMIAKVLETHGPRTLGGYDIGCSFESTVKKSSLGPLFEAKKARLCVNAFHGYSHSHLCQLQYHPNIIKGIGLEDLETMERIFSSSNQLASVIRYASRYRRRLFIEAFIRQWDADKYQNLGTFLLRNYEQALDILRHDRQALEESKAQLSITDADMDTWEKEERHFFAHLGEEQEYDKQAVAYVELLQELQIYEQQRSSMAVRFVPVTTPASNTREYEANSLTTHRAEARRLHAIEEHRRLDIEIRELELLMGVESRWTPATQQYIDAVKYLKERKYRRALDKLQGLVIQRLFELHKLNLSRTGECYCN